MGGTVIKKDDQNNTSFNNFYKHVNPFRERDNYNFDLDVKFMYCTEFKCFCMEVHVQCILWSGSMLSNMMIDTS